MATREITFRASVPVTAIRGDGLFHRRGQPADFDSVEAEAARAVQILTDALTMAGLSSARAQIEALSVTALAEWIPRARTAALEGEPLSISDDEQLDAAAALATERAQAVNEAVRLRRDEGRIGAAVRAARGE